MSDIVKAPPVAPVVSGPHLSREQVDLLKRTICAGSTDDELQLFVATANRLGLDPFARQIFAVKRWDSRTKNEVMSIQVSIDGFRLVAERTGCYVPGRATNYVMDDDDKLFSVNAYVKKYTHGQWHEVEEEAFFEEYVQLNREGKPNAMWGRMPRVMLAKCAEARALRRAFPAELSGVYAPEELEHEFSIVATVEPEPEIDVEAYIARFAAAESSEALDAMRPELNALPLGDAKKKLQREFSKHTAKFWGKPATHAER
jgi:phage recombination protein Bet